MLWKAVKGEQVDHRNMFSCKPFTQGFSSDFATRNRSTWVIYRIISAATVSDDRYL